jgi:hypothetical protein
LIRTFKTFQTTPTAFTLFDLTDFQCKTKKTTPKNHAFHPEAA